MIVLIAVLMLISRASASLTAPSESHLGCAQIVAMARMARASNRGSLLNVSSEAGHSYVAQLVFAYRLFEIDSKSAPAAGRLLRLIPNNKSEQTAVLTMGDYLCQDEKGDDVAALARVRDGFYRVLADAVLVDPRYLGRYMAYSKFALDPHSDYALQLSRICHAEHSSFLKAFGSMSSKNELWLKKYVINPDTCHAYFLPEAK